MSFISKDCTTTYTCNNNSLTYKQQTCGENAICTNNGITSQSQCICKLGFTGDGYICNSSKRLIIQNYIFLFNNYLLWSKTLFIWKNEKNILKFVL